MKIVHRTRAMPSYVRAGIRKCARIRALSNNPVKWLFRSRHVWRFGWVAFAWPVRTARCVRADGRMHGAKSAGKCVWESQEMPETAENKRKSPLRWNECSGLRGADGSRNRDLFDANEALYQLSYSPMCVTLFSKTTLEILVRSVEKCNSTLRVLCLRCIRRYFYDD